MSKKTKYALLFVDVFTFLLILIQTQSSIVRLVKFIDQPLWEILKENFSRYTYYGLASVLNTRLGSFITLMKVFLFFANIYAVIKKLILIFKKMIDLRLALLVLLNLLFIGLKVLEALGVWEMWMSV